MKCSLISYTGFGNPDPYYAAKLLVYTKSTRLEQGEDMLAQIFNKTPEQLAPDLDYISKTLRSSWEFVDYVFQINDVTRAFTHQLVRTRTGTYAQQAQRVVDMSNFKTEKPVTITPGSEAEGIWDYTMLNIARAYQDLKAMGIPTQDCRGVLPTNVHTNIIAKFNLRTMADLLAKRKNLRAQGEYADVARAMEAEILRVHPWAKPFIDPERLQTPALDAILKEALGTAGPLDKPQINQALKEMDALKGVWG